MAAYHCFKWTVHVIGAAFVLVDKDWSLWSILSSFYVMNFLCGPYFQADSLNSDKTWNDFFKNKYLCQKGGQTCRNIEYQCFFLLKVSILSVKCLSCLFPNQWTKSCLSWIVLSSWQGVILTVITHQLRKASLRKCSQSVWSNFFNYSN